MTVDYWALDQAFRRHLFRNPQDEKKTLSDLDYGQRERVVREAVLLQMNNRG